VQADLDGAPLFGIVDRLERRGDRLVVSDYKTGKAPKWQEEVDEKLEQLRLYAAILEAQGTPVSTLRLLFLSPQLGAAAKAARSAEAFAVARRALDAALPGRAAGDIDAVIGMVEAAMRQAREEASPTEDRAERSRVAAIDAAWVATEDLGVGADDRTAAAQLLLDTVAAKRRAFFADRDASASVPGEIVIDVQPEHIAAARAEVAEVWAEANAAYDAWQFPAHTGVLCDWCPFASQCDEFAAWDAAGRPAPPPSVPKPTATAA
jgi:RecB family exonuclease